MKTLALVLALGVGGNVVASEPDAPVAFHVDMGKVAVSGTADEAVVGPGVYMNDAEAVLLVTDMKKMKAENDALSTALDEDEKKLQAKSNAPIIAAILVGIVCLGGGIALGSIIK